MFHSLYSFFPYLCTDTPTSYIPTFNMFTSTLHILRYIHLITYIHAYIQGVSIYTRETHEESAQNSA